MLAKLQYTREHVSIHWWVNEGLEHRLLVNLQAERKGSKPAMYTVALEGHSGASAVSREEHQSGNREA